ncbi:right-handed parallel beta-helix repeat-containing protein [Granulicella sp. S156]|uniref:right-handed parallel beta-helix repeat-containing protein n=1 Tax=Granulicella sp. S156 TaxID=1747224 RepID=UPI00131D3280|nr:right-handed parallel beta-helix repeat-containing protein [Granulicella sp. S156]
MRWIYTAIIVSSTLLMHTEAIGQIVDISTYGAKPDSGQNSSPAVAKAIDFALRHHRSKIVFQHGRYDFWPQGAVMRHLFVSNHDGVAERAVGISIEHASGLELDGNGSEFVFHDSMLPIVISDSDRVTLRNFSIDYANPHLVQAKVVSKHDGFVDLHIDSPLSYSVKDDHIFIRAEDAPLGSEQLARGSVVFDPEGKWLVAGTGDNWEIDKTTAKRIDRDDVRLSGLTQQTRPGDVLMLWNGDRPNPAILVSQSSHIAVSSAQVYSAMGMGFIAQYSDDIHLDRFNVILKPGSNRYVSTTGDAVHFSNCRGQLLVENGLFENMLDDAINVHGSYLRIAAEPAPDTLILEFGHPQTFGLPFASSGDILRLVHPKALEPYATAKVAEVHSLDDKHLRVRFTEALPSSVAVKDAVENLAWQPNVIYRNNHIRHNRARGALFGSQASTVVEDNFFDHLSGPAILFNSDASNWFENAPAHNVLVRHNRFLDTNMGHYGEGSILIDFPADEAKGGDYFNARNIRIEDNSFEQFQHPLLYATSVDGLSFTHNRILFNHDYPTSSPADAPVFSMSHTRCVDVSQNVLQNNDRASTPDPALLNIKAPGAPFDATSCIDSFHPLNAR